MKSTNVAEHIFPDTEVSLFTREWIEIDIALATEIISASPSLRGSGLKSESRSTDSCNRWSPSLRGSGLKFYPRSQKIRMPPVSLFTREWIEIPFLQLHFFSHNCVSLFTREWIEISHRPHAAIYIVVSLFTREWIEIGMEKERLPQQQSLPLYEGVD